MSKKMVRIKDRETNKEKNPIIFRIIKQDMKIFAYKFFFKNYVACPTRLFYHSFI